MDPYSKTVHRVENPNRIAGADLVVGIPSFREADSIGHVVEQVARGLLGYASDRKVAIVNMDNASDDGTEAAFFEAAAGPVPRLYVTTPPGVTGKGNNIHNLLSLVRQWRPEAVAVVDADLLSITPEWVDRLLGPILEGYDFVTPRYVRHPHDGTITNHVCYPMLHGLCGTELRQPIGGDFAFSSWMADRWLGHEWSPTRRQYGVDISMTLQAIFAGARIGEAGLGAKIHKPSAPKLGPMFLQVVDSLFNLLLENRMQWCDGDAEIVVDVLRGEDTGEPQEMVLDAADILAKARSELVVQAGALAEVLPHELANDVSAAIRNGTGGLDRDIWQQGLYDALLAYCSGAEANAVACLRPLYYGRVARFVADTEGLPTETCEAMIQEQAQAFRDARGYVVERLDGWIAA